MLRFIKEKFPLFLICYFILFTLVRVFKPTLELDEAEQIYLSQWWFIGNGQQPPLYTWIQKIIIEVLGFNWFSIAFLRSGLLFTTFFLFYKLSKEYLSKNWAVICSFSLILFIQISIESFRHSHTVLITALSVLYIFQLHKILKNKTLKNYLYLGGIIGLGLLSKHNFSIILIASIAALAFTKREVLNWKFLISILIGLLIFLPHGIWLLENYNNISESFKEDLNAKNYHYSQSIWKGLVNLTITTFSFLIPIFLFVIILARKKLIEFIKLFSKKITYSELKFLILFSIFSFSILLILVLFFNTNSFKERWLEPLFIFIPIILFKKLEAKKITTIDTILHPSLKFLLTFSILVLIYHSVRFKTEEFFKVKTRSHCNYKSLNKELKIYQKDTIFTQNFNIAGNLKILNPKTIFITVQDKNDATKNYVLVKCTMKSKRFDEKGCFEIEEFAKN